MRLFQVLVLMVPLVLSIPVGADPKSHYMIHCMGCHLADGRGQPPDVPVLGKQLGAFTHTDEGRAYLVRVPGASQALINDKELASVINWMLHRYSESTLPSDFRPYSGEEVGRHRRNVLADPGKLRARLLEP